MPGTRAKATIAISLPSAADGEPIEATLDEPLLNRGDTILPRGTRAIGRGSAFNDGTASPRLAIRFTTFVLPDSTVRHLTGVAFAIEDERIGIPVPVNHQLARKGERIGLAAGIAGAEALAANALPQPTAGSVFQQESPANEALRQAYSQTQGVAAAELGLNQPPVAALLQLDRGRQLWIEFGMPNLGGGA